MVSRLAITTKKSIGGLRMRNLEQIKERINNIEEDIEYRKKSAVAQMQVVSKKIVNYSDSPEYISKWLPTWMNDVNYQNEQINELNKQLQLLKWVLNEDK
jgi:hypothetical protein